MAPELELVELKARVERLEAIVRRLAGEEHSLTAPAPSEPLNRERLLAWLKIQGLIVEPPPIARDHAECWRTLSKEEKQQIRQELDCLPSGPMVSDILIESRR